MKRYIVSVCLAVATLVTGKVEVQAQTVGFSSYVWHSQFTQAQRNYYLVMTAQSQLNTYGGQCKDWVAKIVYWTCGVQLPQNASGPAPWYWQVPAVSYIGTGSPIVPGCIIQMQVPNKYTGVLGPHTAIVTAVTSDGLDFIDSNWQGDGIVRRHFVKYSDFNRWTQSRYYTVYTIR